MSATKIGPKKRSAKSVPVILRRLPQCFKFDHNHFTGYSVLRKGVDKRKRLFVEAAGFFHYTHHAADAGLWTKGRCLCILQVYPE